VNTTTLRWARYVAAIGKTTYILRILVDLILRGWIPARSRKIWNDNVSIYIRNKVVRIGGG
jgi:hypothetical protein